MSRKKPKTLSGIETTTPYTVPAKSVPGAGKNLKPYQGLKRTARPLHPRVHCRKKPKTLSGIETFLNKLTGSEMPAGKNLKPYQGLKP